MEFYLHFSLDMARSPGFGSMATDFIRAINTRFPFASVTESLKLASYYNSPDQVSGTLSLPSRGAFHLSLTVLLLYRSSGSI